ncbi:hypothetical protein METHP14_200018 [Pseudomonas sp. P14-2025]
MPAVHKNQESACSGLAINSFKQRAALHYVCCSSIIKLDN